MPFTQYAPSAFCAIPCQPWRGHCSPPLPAPAARISVPLTARPILLQTQIAALAASLDTELPEGNSGVGFRCVCLRGCRPAVGMLWPCHTSARSSASPRPAPSECALGAGFWPHVPQPPGPQVEALAVLPSQWFPAHTRPFLPSPLPLGPFSALPRRGKFLSCLKNTAYLGQTFHKLLPPLPPKHLRDRGIQVSAPLSTWPGPNDSPTAGVVYPRTKN